MARPAAFEKYPNVSTYLDRKGETRYRFRLKNVNATLRGEFDSAEFQAHYHELVTLAGAGAITAAKPEIKLPEDCFRHCWNDFKVSRDFTERLGDYAIGKIKPVLERFLTTPIKADVPEVTFDMVPVKDIEFHEVEDYLWAMATNKSRDERGKLVGGKHAANFARVQIIKLFDYVVRRKRWIKPAENPMPYVKKVLTDKTDANRAWTPEEQARFETCYPLGTMAHAVYALAKYAGNRRSDVATIGWDDVVELPRLREDGSIAYYQDAFQFRQEKNSMKKGGEGGKLVTILIVPQLAAALSHIERVPGQPVLINERGQPYAIASLTQQMRRWRRAAGLSDECTLHGLRSTYATMLEQAGVSNKAQSSSMGHSDERTTRHYSRGAKNILSAIEAGEKLTTYNPEAHAVRPGRHLRMLKGGKDC
jgi:integrase